MAPTLHLLCGLPAAGKTTLARQMEAAGAGVWLNCDRWVWTLFPDDAEAAARDQRKQGVERVQWEVAETLLSNGVSVILDWGLWAREERDGYAQRARSLGADVRLEFLDVPLEVLHERIEERNRHLPPGMFHISPEELDEWITWFEPPAAEELRSFNA